MDQLKEKALDVAKVDVIEKENVRILNVTNDQTKLWFSAADTKGFSVFLVWSKVTFIFILSKI